MNAQNPGKARAKPIPAEGQDGLFRQSWYPICLSSELPKGQLLGRGFLDGRVVVFRGDDGVARVMSAYCPHVGADLGVGQVVGNNVQCAFHHWEYDGNGQCVKTGIGDPPPRRAQLFKFPTIERWGIIWAFNGTEPLFELPIMEYPEDEMHIFNYTLPEPLNCDPWVFAANTPDMQHLKVVHKVQFNIDDPHDLVEWDEFGLKYRVQARHQGGVDIDWTLRIRGSSFFCRTGTYKDYWCAAVTGFGIPRPGVHTIFGATIVLKGKDQEAQMAEMKAISQRTIEEDKDILNTIHYRQGYFTQADRTLSKYLSIVRDFPRAHPSAGFIN
nr:Rieske 2Fe-2S domain-containing protein [Mesorhizobium sp.]